MNEYSFHANTTRLSDDWQGLDTVVLYGAGNVSLVSKPLFEKFHIHILCVIDNDSKKAGNSWLGAPVMPYDEARERIAGHKIVVMAAHEAYGSILRMLEQDGLVEYRDFCNIGQFITEWMWTEHRLNCIFHMDMAITTRCTLNCRHCNMFIPYHDTHVDYTFEELKESIDLFFHRIDFVTYLGFLGGETFLSPVLERLIIYTGDHYSDRIGRLSLQTNGTVEPTESLLATVKKYNVFFAISDYSVPLHYEAKMDKLVQRLDSYGIEYIRRDSIPWVDFGFPEHPVRRTAEQAKAHTACCKPNWNGLHGDKFYYCNVSWAAQQSGHFQLSPEDYVVLTDINPDDKEDCRRIVELSRGTSSFCNICGGCGRDNQNYVPTAVQMERK
jgi:hypothetical protein